MTSMASVVSSTALILNDVLGFVRFIGLKRVVLLGRLFDLVVLVPFRGRVWHFPAIRTPHFKA